jgi:hypothetical protein
MPENADDRTGTVVAAASYVARKDLGRCPY